MNTLVLFPKLSIKSSLGTRICLLAKNTDNKSSRLLSVSQRTVSFLVRIAHSLALAQPNPKWRLQTRAERISYRSPKLENSRLVHAAVGQPTMINATRS